MSRDALAKNFDKERIFVVEIDVPRCVNTFGVTPCTATGSGDAKCYNTRATCQDLANFNDKITAGPTTISVNATNRTFTRSSGGFTSDGFAVGQVIRTSGFSNAGNNSEFEIESVTSTVITVTSKSAYTLVTETGSGDEQITTPNYFTYKHCTPRSPHPSGLNNCAPCVKSVSVAPAKLDPKGGIGVRASASITMDDFPSSDGYGIDPYLNERTYNPLEVGTYWPKWRTRNANYENLPVRIKTGYIVNDEFDEANFVTKHYVLSKFTVANGRASLTCKDPLQLVSNKKATAPKASSGTLSADISASATSLTLTPSGIGNLEYPNPSTDGNFHVKIGKEILLCTARSGDTLTVVRGQKNTVATAHDRDDTVQLCLEYNATPPDEIQADLMINYAGIPARFIPRGSWATEASGFSNPTALIAEPTPVNKLIGELCDSFPHKFFWDDSQNEIVMQALTSPPTSNNVLTEEDHLISLSSRDLPEQQISTVLVRYGQIDPTKKLDEPDNYKVSYARVNTDAIARYESNNTKIFYSRWIIDANGAAARQLATLVGRRFGITPRYITFQLEDKDSLYKIGDIVDINHSDIVDQNGNNTNTTFEIVSSAEGDFFNYEALEFAYDKSLPEDTIPTEDEVDISVNSQNINLRTLYESVYGTPNSSTVARFIVYSGVVVGSSSTSSEALDTGSWPSGATVKLELKSGAYVVGAGGNGGGASANGGNGGDAIHLSFNLEIINNGIIGGGGGGGGGATVSGAAAGGGGGAGSIAGAAGTGTSGNVSRVPTAGSTTSGGQGGRASSGGAEPLTATGGSGGGLGQNGSPGTADFTTDGLGGSAGRAIVKNGFTLTQTVAGDIRGSIV